MRDNLPEPGTPDFNSVVPFIPDRPSRMPLFKKRRIVAANLVILTIVLFGGLIVYMSAATPPLQ